MFKKRQEKIESVIHEEIPTPEFVHEEISATEDVPQSSPKISFLEKVIVSLLVGLIFLFPIFFLPVPGVLPGFAKNVLLSVGVIAIFIMTLILWMKEGKIVLLKNHVFTALFSLLIVSVFSSAFSGSFSNSFFGAGTEITATITFLLLSVLVFLLAALMRTSRRIFFVFLALFTSSFLVFLFQLFHIVVPDLNVGGVFSNKVSNLVGGWGDFGVFSGIIVLVSVLALERLRVRDVMKKSLLFLLLTLSLFFYSMSLLAGSWFCLGIFALAISVFSFFENISRSEEENISVAEKWMMRPSFAVAVISFAMVFFGPYVNGRLFSIFDIPPIETYRPSFSGTYAAFLGSMKEGSKNIILGVGPNRFFIPWQKYRPVEINYSPVWNVDFNEGAGTLSSVPVTTGILGSLLWLVFIIVFIVGGIRNLRNIYRKTDNIAQFIAISSFVGALYCFVVSFMSTVGAVPLFFAFVFVGLFLGALSAMGAPQVLEYSYLREPQKGFTILVSLLLLLGLSAGLGYSVFKRAQSVFAYRNAIISSKKGDIENAGTFLRKAISLSPSDAYFRSDSALNSFQAEKLIFRTDISPDEFRQQFGSVFQVSVASASSAIAIDDANYLNWVSLGNAYSIIVSLGIPNVSIDAYTQSKKAFEEAVKRNPMNPQTQYDLARLALSAKQLDDAERFAEKAVALKRNHSEAFILLSQIEETRSGAAKALLMMEGANAYEFSDSAVLYRLGYLRYMNGDYLSAVSALEKSVKITPDYSNAKYFLGLSYFKTGQSQKSIKEFQDIERLNPDRTDIAGIIKNIKTGNSPISDSVTKETPSNKTATSSLMKTLSSSPETPAETQ